MSVETVMLIAAIASTVISVGISFYYSMMLYPVLANPCRSSSTSPTTASGRLEPFATVNFRPGAVIH